MATYYYWNKQYNSIEQMIKNSGLRPQQLRGGTSIGVSAWTTAGEIEDNKKIYHPELNYGTVETAPSFVLNFLTGD